MGRVLAWALFDLANTFFAVAMLSFYFPLWMVEDHGAKELTFSLTLGISMTCVGILMPFCGALSDATGERMRFLRWTTYGCVLMTLIISASSRLDLALVCFAAANVCYQLGGVFYDALLSTVAPVGRLGFVSGFGASFGYLGSMVGLLLLWPFVRSGGHRAAFAPSAVLFLVFALPSFVLIKERPRRTRLSWRGVVQEAMGRLAQTVQQARAQSGVWRFLGALFFSMAAINTIVTFMAVYTRKVAGFTEREIIQFFLFSQVFAVAGSLAFGSAIAHWGSKRTLSCIWGGWVVALGLVAMGRSGWWLWLTGPVIGFCLGSAWATARVLVTELSPQEHLAELLGLAGLVVRFSSVIGPLVWGLIVWDPRHYRHAVLVMIACLIVGIGLLQRVPERARRRMA